MAGDGEVLALESDVLDFVPEDAAALGFEARAGGDAEDGGVVNFGHEFDHDDDGGPDGVAGHGVAAGAEEAVAEVFGFSGDADAVQPVAEGGAVALFFFDKEFDGVVEVGVVVGLGVFFGGGAEVGAFAGFAELPGGEGLGEGGLDFFGEVRIGGWFFGVGGDGGGILLIVGGPLARGAGVLVVHVEDLWGAA